MTPRNLSLPSPDCEAPLFCSFVIGTQYMTLKFLFIRLTLKTVLEPSTNSKPPPFLGGQRDRSAGVM